MNQTPVFVVQLASGREVEISDADAYQPEGPMTTFFKAGSSRKTIDSWSVRVASLRTADVVSIIRTTSAVDESILPSRVLPILVAA